MDKSVDHVFVSVAVLACITVVLIAASNAGANLTPAFACLIGPAILLLARKRLQPMTTSPAWIMVLVLSTIGIAGLLFQSGLNAAAGGGIILALDADDVRRTSLLFGASSSFIAAGAGMSAFAGPARPRTQPKMEIRLRRLGLVQITCLVPAVVLTIGTGGQLLQRAAHLTEAEGTSFTAIAGKLAIAAVAASGYLVSQSRGPRRAIAWSGLLVYELIFFALSSRGFALMPVVFAMGMFVGRRGRRGGAYLLLGAALTVLLLPIPLFLRDQSSHGLIPYLDHIGSFSYTGVDWRASLQNVLIAFPIAGTTAFHVGDLPSNWLWIELNPLPGTMAGWYDIAPYMSLNRWTPFSAVGELGNYGFASLAAVWTVFGAVLAYLDRRVGAYAQSGHGLAGVALVGLSGLVAANALQYSLRTVLRILLYTVLLDLVLRYLTRRRTSKRLAAYPTLIGQQPPSA